MASVIVATGVQVNRLERVPWPCREAPPCQFYAISSSIIYLDRNMHTNHAANVQSLAHDKKSQSIHYLAFVPGLYQLGYRLGWQERYSPVLYR